MVDTVKQRLIDRGFTLAERIPAVNATFTVFESADVGKVQKAFNLLDTLGYWLPFILVAMAGLGIYLAPNHRTAFIWTGVGVALAGAGHRPAPSSTPGPGTCRAFPPPCCRRTRPR